MRPRPGRPAADPFTVLGLQPSRDVSDDAVRAAWRRAAAASHPDREDGGDPGQFAAAAAAYTVLRTRFGRGEVIADLATASRTAGRTRLRNPVILRSYRTRSGAAARLAARLRGGRPARLALRILATGAASAAAVAAAGSHPAAPALVTGALTWLAVTARRDLAPPPG